MNERMGWLDDDEDAVVVPVAELERHVELVTNNHSNKNHYNNCSGDKQSGSYQQRKQNTNDERTNPMPIVRGLRSSA